MHAAAVISQCFMNGRPIRVQGIHANSGLRMMHGAWCMVLVRARRCTPRAISLSPHRNRASTAWVVGPQRCMMMLRGVWCCCMERVAFQAPQCTRRSSGAIRELKRYTPCAWSNPCRPGWMSMTCPSACESGCQCVCRGAESMLSKKIKRGRRVAIGSSSGARRWKWETRTHVR